MLRLIKIIFILCLVQIQFLNLNGQDSLRDIIVEELDSVKTVIGVQIDAEIRALKYQVSRELSRQQKEIDSLNLVTQYQDSSIKHLEQEKRDLEEELVALQLFTESYKKKSSTELVRQKKILVYSISIILFLVITTSALLFRLLYVQKEHAYSGLVMLSGKLRSEIRKTRKKLRKEFRKDFKKLRRKNKKK